MDVCESDEGCVQLAEPLAFGFSFAKILYWSHATSNARGAEGVFKSGLRHIKSEELLVSSRGGTEDLKAASNPIHYVDDSLTLLIILRVKPISPDSVQTVSWRSSMGAGQLQPKGREQNMTL